jgi:hypothetical protein
MPGLFHGGVPASAAPPEELLEELELPELPEDPLEPEELPDAPPDELEEPGPGGLPTAEPPGVGSVPSVAVADEPDELGSSKRFEGAEPLQAVASASSDSAAEPNANGTGARGAALMTAML